MGLITGYRERTSWDRTRFLTESAGDEPKAGKRRDQSSLGRNKHGKIEGQGECVHACRSKYQQLEWGSGFQRPVSPGASNW